MVKSVHTDSLWPKTPWHKVQAALMLNVPPSRGKQTYHFCMKKDLSPKEHKDAVQTCITLQSTGHVLFNANPNSVKETERIADYCGLHRAHLRDIAKALPDNTVLLVVGKLTKYEGRETFLVYYLIENTRIVLDSVTIKSILNPKNDNFEDFLLCLGPYTLVEVEVESEPGVVTCEELEKYVSGPRLLGFPIAKMESRGYNETPIMTTTPMHMRFMAFTYLGAAQ